MRLIFTTDSVIEDAGFEAVFDATEGTNFDFWFKTADSRKLFEIKLTEVMTSLFVFHEPAQTFR